MSEAAAATGASSSLFDRIRAPMAFLTIAAFLAYGRNSANQVL